MTTEEDILFSKLKDVPLEEDLILSKLKGIPPTGLLAALNKVWGPPYTTFEDACKREQELLLKYKWTRNEVDRYYKSLEK